MWQLVEGGEGMWERGKLARNSSWWQLHLSAASHVSHSNVIATSRLCSRVQPKLNHWELLTLQLSIDSRATHPQKPSYSANTSSLGRPTYTESILSPYCERGVDNMDAEAGYINESEQLGI